MGKEEAKGRWHRYPGTVKHEDTPYGRIRVLSDGEDAPLERSDLRFILTLLAAILAIAILAALIADLVGWI